MIQRTQTAPGTGGGGMACKPYHRTVQAVLESGDAPVSSGDRATRRARLIVQCYGELTCRLQIWVSILSTPLRWLQPELRVLLRAFSLGPRPCIYKEALDRAKEEA